MLKKIQTNIKNMLVSLRPAGGSIRPFIFRPAHFISLVVFGLMLMIPSAVTLINTAVPFTWERIGAVVSTVSQNEAVSGRAQYTATVVFKLNDQIYTLREDYVGERPSRDDEVTVYYNPSNPNEAMARKGSPLSVLAWTPLLVGLGILGFAGYRQYVSYQRSQKIKALTAKGRAIPVVVDGSEVIDKKSFIQKLLYSKYIFFKLKAIPAASKDGAGQYESEVLMWRSKMYGDVDSIKEKKTPVVIYVDEKNSERYYFEPPVIEEEAAEEIIAVPEETETPSPTPAAIITRIDEGFESASTEPANTMSLAQEVSQPAPVLSSANPEVDNTTDSNSEAVSTPAPNQEDDGLDVSAIDELEKSLASINAAPAPIDLTFKDDPENINNQQATPAPSLGSAPVITPSPTPVQTSAPVTQTLSSTTQSETPPVITGVSSVTTKQRPSTKRSAAPAVSQPLPPKQDTVINPITNIGESLTPASTPAPATSVVAPVPVTAAPQVATPVPTVAPTPVTNPVATPAPVPPTAPAPVAARDQIANVSRSDRKISVPRR